MKEDNRKELGETFDTTVSLYEKMRPGYVDDLYRAIFEYVKIEEAIDRHGGKITIKDTLDLELARK